MTNDRVIEANGKIHKCTLTGKWPTFTATLANGKSFVVDASNATIIPNKPTNGRVVQL